MRLTRISVAILVLTFVLSATLALAEEGIGVDERGEIGGAPFRIRIPDDWNRGLVLYAHGYLPRGATWRPLDDSIARAYLGRGYALAESGYARQGWALEEGVHDTEALRKHFVKARGAPERTFVTGHSLGGLITLATIETFPEAYDGALPMCAPLAPALAFFKRPIFDSLVTFEAAFGGALPERLRPLIDAPALPPADVAKALESDPGLADRFARHWDIPRNELVAILTLYHRLYLELCDRAGGRPIDNRNTVYSGFDSVPRLNDLVRRYAADPKALDYLVRHYTPTGEIEDPVLAVHTTCDPGVPPRVPNGYDVTVALKGRGEWFVQKRVDAYGHCNFDPEVTGKAFDELVRWATEGVRPEPGAFR
jgi:pimeloyl-ACP methyl ester carboxylesterase